jgi:hypothetical protein
MTTRPTKITLLWLILFFFLIHSIEEVLFMRETLDQVRTGMPKFLKVVIPPVSYEQFLISLVIITLLVFCVAYFGHLDRQRGWGVYVMVGLQVVLFLNVFAHLISLLVVGSYTAGLATSLAINLPFSIYLFWRLLREQWMRPPTFVLLFPLAAVVHVPILFGFLYISGFISRFLFGR